MSYVPQEEMVINVIQGDKVPERLIIDDNNANRVETIATANVSTSAWPYLQYPYQYGYYQKTPWVSIERAENGFIVVKNGQTFVCKTVDEITKILSKKD